jgi:imidazoleglycerol-phosphate dehydratase/histidinol-phosphatase
MKKVLFIDRDGTILIEPPDEQIDSFEKMEFYPGVITNLKRIASDLNYDLVMITNQDGLGTDSFPEESFWPVQNKMLQILKNEGVEFRQIFIDHTLPDDNAPTRKPGTALLKKYLKGDYDLPNSYVIGDRKTDVKLARNLGAKSILISKKKYAAADFVTNDWDEIYRHLILQARVIEVKRQTKETDISMKINLDGKGIAEIKSDMGFLNHMLELFARHASVDLFANIKGDLHIDEHHTVEDTAIVLGEALTKALGDKSGIERYGFLLPMDEARAEVAIDFSGRSTLIWKVKFQRKKIGGVPTEMFYHFFKSFCENAKCALYIRAKGKNEHHKIEAIFKAVARSIKMAIKRDADNLDIPSTKGRL